VCETALHKQTWAFVTVQLKAYINSSICLNGQKSLQLSMFGGNSVGCVGAAWPSDSYLCLAANIVIASKRIEVFYTLSMVQLYSLETASHVMLIIILNPKPYPNFKFFALLHASNFIQTKLYITLSKLLNKGNHKQKRECTYNVTMRSVHETIAPWKRNTSYIFVCVSVCACVCMCRCGYTGAGVYLRSCSLTYPACTCCFITICGLSGSTKFFDIS
jgi:hypothetical protein